MSDQLPTSKPPNMTALLVCVMVTWLAALVATVGGIMTGDWALVVMAFSASLCAAGWATAVRQWAEWRALAYGLAALADHLPRSDD